MAKHVTLAQYLHKNHLGYADISAIVGCTPQYIGMVARQKRKPSWKVAGLIEKATLGEVSRDIWYPPGDRYDA